MNCQMILKLVGEPQWLSSPLSTTLSMIPPVGNVGNCEVSEVPTVKQLGYEDVQEVCVIAYFLSKLRVNFMHTP